MAGNRAVVLAGVEGGDVVELMLVSEVVGRLALFLSRDLDNAERNVVRAVLPHGNSTGDVKKED